jgi:predicted esterase
MPRTTTAAISLTLLITAQLAGGQPPSAPSTPSTPTPAPALAPGQPPKPQDAKPPKVVEPKPTGNTKGEPLDPKTKLAEAKPNTVYTAVSGCTGYTDDALDRVGLLKYSWVLPEGFERNKPRDVVVILHGYGLDHTWGPAALPAKDLAPGAIVVSVDGSRETGADDHGRAPGLEIADVLLMRDFVLEMTRTFPTAKIILVGHSQGAFGMVMLANRFPRLFNGVVVYGGGVPNMPLNNLRYVPTAFIHGTADELVPLRIAVDGRDVLQSVGARAVVLRRVVGAGHAPDVKEAAIGVTWVRALVTENAAESLAGAKALVTLGPDRAPAFGMAQNICKRFEADPEDKAGWPRGFKDATDEQKKEAKALSEAIEAQGLRQVTALRASLPDAAALRAATFAPDAPTPNWLGHLLSLREDFKNVVSVDAFMKELGYDDLLTEHEEAGAKIVAALEAPEWGGAGAMPKEAFAAVIENLPKAYLVEGLPHNLEANMKDWGARAKELNIPQAQQDLLPVVSQYLGAVKKGRERYKELNAQWKP